MSSKPNNSKYLVYFDNNIGYARALINVFDEYFKPNFEVSCYNRREGWTTAKPIYELQYNLETKHFIQKFTSDYINECMDNNKYLIDSLEELLLIKLTNYSEEEIVHINATYDQEYNDMRGLKTTIIDFDDYLIIQNLLFNEILGGPILLPTRVIKYYDLEQNLKNILWFMMEHLCKIDSLNRLAYEPMSMHRDFWDEPDEIPWFYKSINVKRYIFSEKLTKNDRIKGCKLLVKFKYRDSHNRIKALPGELILDSVEKLDWPNKKEDHSSDGITLNQQNKEQFNENSREYFKMVLKKGAGCGNFEFNSEIRPREFCRSDLVNIMYKIGSDEFDIEYLDNDFDIKELLMIYVCENNISSLNSDGWYADHINNYQYYKHHSEIDYNSNNLNIDPIKMNLAYLNKKSSIKDYNYNYLNDDERKELVETYKKYLHLKGENWNKEYIYIKSLIKLYYINFNEDTNMIQFIKNIEKLHDINLKIKVLRYLKSYYSLLKRSIKGMSEYDKKFNKKKFKLLNKEFIYFKNIYNKYYLKYALIIQRNYRISRYNPKYKLCNKYIDKNYRESVLD